MILLPWLITHDMVLTTVTMPTLTEPTKVNTVKTGETHGPPAGEINHGNKMMILMLSMDSETTEHQIPFQTAGEPHTEPPMDLPHLPTSTGLENTLMLHGSWEIHQCTLENLRKKLSHTILLSALKAVLVTLVVVQTLLSTPATDGSKVSILVSTPDPAKSTIQPNLNAIGATSDGKCSGTG